MKKCSVNGCGRDHYGLGYCTKHYERFKKYGDVSDPIEHIRNRKCSVEGCNNDYYGLGYCNGHYQRFKRTGSIGTAPIRQQTTPKKLCSVENCNNIYYANGFCIMHNTRWQRNGSTELPTKEMKKCVATDCDADVHSKGYCRKHYNKLRLTGTLERLVAPAGTGCIDKNGYKVFFKNGKSVFEHREIMGIYLGRPLLPNENVHHKNGNRADNRLENLEIWNTQQPIGQRVEDKIKWAKEILALYEPDPSNVIINGDVDDDHYW